VPFELLELIPHGSEALNELCDSWNRFSTRPATCQMPPRTGIAMPSGWLRHLGRVDAKAMQDSIQPRCQIGLTGVEVRRTAFSPAGALCQGL
jgi:hypothetical protein